MAELELVEVARLDFAVLVLNLDVLVVGFEMEELGLEDVDSFDTEVKVVDFVLLVLDLGVLVDFEVPVLTFAVEEPGLDVDEPNLEVEETGWVVELLVGENDQLETVELSRDEDPDVDVAEVDMLLLVPLWYDGLLSEEGIEMVDEMVDDVVVGSTEELDRGLEEDDVDEIELLVEETLPMLLEDGVLNEELDIE